MSIEADAQKDLALNAEDAENVVGGVKKKAKKVKHVVQKATGRAGPNINIQGPTTPIEFVSTDDCDPGQGEQ